MTRDPQVLKGVRPESAAFSTFLGLLAALPTMGIDMVLPSLPTTVEALHAPTRESGLAMSAYLLSLGGALLVWGPLSDRFGRKPIIVWGCALLIAGSAGCLVAGSFPQFLACRALQGIGASAPGMAALAMVRDAFEGERARAKMSFVVGVINVVPMLAPSIGALLLATGGWRAIHAAPVVAALLVLSVVRLVGEMAPLEVRRIPRTVEVARDYGRILLNPICLGNALCNAAAAAAVFAYITGSSLVLIAGSGVSPARYGLIFGTSSLAVMGGAFLNERLGARGVSAARVIAMGLALATACALVVLLAAAAGSRAPAWVVVAMIGGALAFGLVSPNAVQGATHPYPDIAGAAGAVAIFLQMAGAAAGSDLVARFFDGRSALSMAGVMLAACLVGIAAYAGLARPAERRADTSRERRPLSAEAPTATKGEPA